MIFQSKWDNASYVVRPTRTVIYPGQGQEIVYGLRAEFRGKHRLFDSAAAAEERNWSKEDEEKVILHLLNHSDFGFGLYLAPNQTIPEDLKAKVRNPSAVSEKEGAYLRCSHMDVTSDDIIQCNQPATHGDFCDRHQKQTIIQGMMTTTNS